MATERLGRPDRMVNKRHELKRIDSDSNWNVSGMTAHARPVIGAKRSFEK